MQSVLPALRGLLDIHFHGLARTALRKRRRQFILRPAALGFRGLRLFGGRLMPVILTLPIMQKMWPHGDQHVPGLMEGIVASAPAVFEKYGIETPLTLALMFGQFSEECGGGLEMQPG